MFIETNRLVIKPYENEDEEDMIVLLTNESIKKTYMIPDFLTKQEAVAMFQKLLAYSHSDAHLELGIYRNGKLIGFLNDVEMDKQKIELGYVIHPDFQGLGYATEALTAVIEILFQCGYNEIVTGAFVDNAASISVMKKCGMKQIDKTEDIEYHKVMHPCVYFAIKK